MKKLLLASKVILLLLSLALMSLAVFNPPSCPKLPKIKLVSYHKQVEWNSDWNRYRFSAIFVADSLGIKAEEALANMNGKSSDEEIKFYALKYSKLSEKFTKIQPNHSADCLSDWNTPVTKVGNWTLRDDDACTVKVFYAHRCMKKVYTFENETITYYVDDFGREAVTINGKLVWGNPYLLKQL